MKFQIEVIKSKIHRVTVTQADLHYVGSITRFREIFCYKCLPLLNNGYFFHC